MTKFSRLNEAERNINVNIGEGEFQIMVNPTPGDIRKMCLKKDTLGRTVGVRCLVTKDGTLYAWSLVHYFEHEQFFKMMKKKGLNYNPAGSALFYVENSVRLDDVFNLMNRNTRQLSPEQLIAANDFTFPGITAFESVAQGKFDTGPVGTLLLPRVTKIPSLSEVNFFVAEPAIIRVSDGKKFVSDFNIPGKWQEFVDFVSI